MKKVKAYLQRHQVGEVEVNNQVDSVTIVLPDNNKIDISLWTSKGDAVLIKPVRNARLSLTPGPVDNSIILTARKKGT